MSEYRGEAISSTEWDRFERDLDEPEIDCGGMGDRRRIWFGEDGVRLDYCNECGVLIPTYNELCMRCQREADEREEDERLSDPNAGCWSYSW